MLMAAMMIVMVVFLVTSGHHGAGGPHQRDANPPAAQSEPMRHDEAAKPAPQEEKP